LIAVIVKVKDLQVDSVVSSGTEMGVGIPKSSLPVDVEVSAIESVSEVEVTFKPRTTGPTSASRGRPDPDFMLTIKNKTQ